MREYRQKKRIRRMFFSRPVFFLFLILAVFLSLSVFRQYKKSSFAVLKNEKVENELRELTDKKENLEASLRQLGTELGEENELRRKFQIKKPGEEFVVIIDNTSTAEEFFEQEPPKEKGFFEKILDLVTSN